VSTSVALRPAFIGRMELRNRLVMPAMATNFATPDGRVTERLIAYHRARAKGGVGLIVVEASYVHPGGKGFSNEVGIYNDDLIPGLKRLVEAVHDGGAKIAIQLFHAGRQTSSKITGQPLVAPSSVRYSPAEEMPKELSLEEIRSLLQAFKDAARRARVAGFDAVEIHGGHGYLLNQFFSPYTNKRTDRYGGSFENRVRFSLEVVAAVREAVGDDFPIIFRLSAEEYVSGGLTLEDTKLLAKEMVRAGVSALHVSAGIRESGAMITPPMAVPQGCYVGYAMSIKEAIGGKVPVIAVGRIRDPLMAEQIISQGKADFVAMGRALLADPDLPNKAAEGKFEDIRRCIGCNEGCIGRLTKGLDITCTVNPLVGREAEFDLSQPAPRAKKVMVVGAGPAGLEAALIAALRGHRVTLYEREAELGGQVRVAAVPPYKAELRDLVDHLVGQVRKVGVTVKTEKEVTLGTVEAASPDVIIVATGGVPVRPEIPGADRDNVVLARDVLTGKARTGQRVVIVGGGLVGCETAEFLADKGKTVTVVEMLPAIASDVEARTRTLLLRRMKEKNITVMVETVVEEIGPNEVIVNTKGERGTIADVDTVVLAVGYRSDNTLLELLQKSGTKAVGVGDCIKPRRILDAIHEGFRVAYKL